VSVLGGSLRVSGSVRIHGSYTQQSATLEVTLHSGHQPAVEVTRRATLGQGSTLSLRFDAEHPPVAGSTVRVLSASSLRGQFDSVEVNSDKLRAVPVYTAEGLSVRLLKR
jgi:hypothetical protein